TDTYILSLHDALPISTIRPMNSARRWPEPSSRSSQWPMGCWRCFFLRRPHRSTASCCTRRSSPPPTSCSLSTHLPEHSCFSRFRSEEHTSELQSRFDL